MMIEYRAAIALADAYTEIQYLKLQHLPQPKIETPREIMIRAMEVLDIDITDDRVARYVNKWVEARK